MIRIAVVDDLPMIRTALRRFFAQEPDLEWVGEAADGEGAIDLLQTQHVDVLVLDLSMPGLGGLAALPRIKAAAPSTNVVVLTAFSPSGFAAMALEAGASEFLEKGGHMEALLQAVRRAADATQARSA